MFILKRAGQRPLSPTMRKGPVPRPLGEKFYFDSGTCGPEGVAGTAGVVGAGADGVPPN